MDCEEGGKQMRLCKDKRQICTCQIIKRASFEVHKNGKTEKSKDVKPDYYEINERALEREKKD